MGSHPVAMLWSAGTQGEFQLFVVDRICRDGRARHRLRQQQDAAFAAGRFRSSAPSRSLCGRRSPLRRGRRFIQSLQWHSGRWQAVAVVLD
jgi:hypothetical protein